MSITITITDPTPVEANAVRAYLAALDGPTAVPILKSIDSDPAFNLRPTYGGERGPELVLPPSPGATETSPVTAEDAGAPDFDSAGFPWNAEIHASSRATLADGTWKKKRGVSDELVAKVEAELRADHAVDLEVTEAEVKKTLAAPDAPEVPEAPVPEPAPTADAPAAPEPNAPSPVADTGSVTDAPAAPPVDTPNPFLAVMSRIGKSGMTKETKDELLSAAGALDDKGNPSILVLNKKPELIAGFVALLDAAGV